MDGGVIKETPQIQKPLIKNRRRNKKQGEDMYLRLRTETDASRQAEDQ